MTLGNTRLYCCLAIAVLLLLASVPAGSAAADSGGGGSQAREQADRGLPEYNEAARFIAGLATPEGSLASLEKLPAWSRYAAAMNRDWERFDTRQLKPMRTWAAQELAGGEETATVFYPFSGPDFVNIYTLFPNAKTYLMVALEPPGTLPDLTPGNLGNFLGSLQRSLYECLCFDFFITAKMASQISKSQLKGVLPVLLFFMAREEVRVLDVRYWLLKPDGTIVEEPATEDVEFGPGVPGLRLVFTSPGSTEKQTLYYFQCNLRNDSFRQKSQFTSFLKGFGPFTTFTKAASYLMFNPNSSDLRQFILERSQFVLQDDSGLPLREFAPTVWDLKFYGTYKGPIALFKRCHQQDLARAYKNGAQVYPLGFGIGYHHRVGTSNLLLAAKKKAESPR